MVVFQNKLKSDFRFLISIVGILDLIKQEIKDLEKEKYKFMKEEFPEEWIIISY